MVTIRPREAEVGVGVADDPQASASTPASAVRTASAAATAGGVHRAKGGCLLPVFASHFSICLPPSAATTASLAQWFLVRH